MNRREFLKSLGIIVGTIAVTKIPTNIPYKLPYWRTALVANKPVHVCFRWDKDGTSKLTLDGIEYDPGSDFVVHDDGMVFADIFRLQSNSDGSLLCWTTPIKSYNFIEDGYFIDDVVHL